MSPSRLLAKYYKIYIDQWGQIKLISHEIRETTNKNWVLGDSKFKQEVAPQLSCRMEPSAKGGGSKIKKIP